MDVGDDIISQILGVYGEAGSMVCTDFVVRFQEIQSANLSGNANAIIRSAVKATLDNVDQYSLL